MKIPFLPVHIISTSEIERIKAEARLGAQLFENKQITALLHDNALLTAQVKNLHRNNPKPLVRTIEQTKKRYGC